MRGDSASPLRAAAPVFAALGDEQRIALLRRLSRGGPASITQLARGARITRQGVSKHLRVLERAGLIRNERVGRESIWSLEPAGLDEARRALEAIARQWDEALERLRAYVEEGREGDLS